MLKGMVQLAVVVAILIGTVSCGKIRGGEQHLTGTESVEDVYAELRADSLLDNAYRTQQYEVVMALADSLEHSDALSETVANYWRGKACVNLARHRAAEYYYKKVVKALSEKDAESKYYTRTVCNLTNLLLARGNYEEALRTAMPAVAKMSKSNDVVPGELADLLTYIGFCQTKLGLQADAIASFDKAAKAYRDAIKTDKDGVEWQNYVSNTYNTAVGYKDVGLYDEALKWSERADSLLHRYAEQRFANPALIDYFKGSIELNRAVSLHKLHRFNEAEYAYDAFRQTKFGNSFLFNVNAVTYLVDAHRFNEAADAYTHLDEILKKSGYQMTLDHIQQFYALKFRANIGAGRKDTALAVGMKIIDALDSAIVWQKRSDAAELAMVYDTQQKETEIARQQAQIAGKDAELSNLRWVGTAIAMVLLTLFFIIYSFYRHKMLKELKIAYNQLEETTAAKERIESELRIARDIQLSMVPHQFPELPNLELYASMTPAREVGGDLYDYILQGDSLYFCIGDVSGKGVPASLLMAEAARLFRTMAKQNVLPVDIANHLNEELSEGNERGMFVTMFIGLVNLQTGHLSYCNCGHNPPVLHHQFLKVEPNAPLGLWPDLKYIGEEVENIKGTPLFLYTDGLNEAENLQQEQFGEERLLRTLQTIPFKHARQLIEQMEKEVNQHRDGAEPNDDLTLMCLKVG